MNRFLSTPGPARGRGGISGWTLLGLALFAAAMAYLEAALVVYLRELLYPGHVQRLFPMTLLPGRLLSIELGREAATMVMLASIAVVSASDRVRRLAVFAFLFGVWDILYYVWLKLIIGWPLSWGGWDILFLIPWVWVGPWVCPALVAGVLVVWSVRVLSGGGAFRFGRVGGVVFVAGTLSILVSFLQPTWGVVSTSGVGGLESYQPEAFWWPLYTVGLVAMAVGLPWAPSRRDGAQ